MAGEGMIISVELVLLRPGLHSSPAYTVLTGDRHMHSQMQEEESPVHDVTGEKEKPGLCS